MGWLSLGLLPYGEAGLWASTVGFSTAEGGVCMLPSRFENMYFPFSALLKRLYFSVHSTLLSFKTVCEIKMTFAQHGASLGVSDNWHNHLIGT